MGLWYSFGNIYILLSNHFIKYIKCLLSDYKRFHRIVDNSNQDQTVFVIRTFEWIL